MKLTIVTIVAVLTAISASAQSVVVVKAISYGAAVNGRITITLASGAEVTIPESDLDVALTGTVSSALTNTRMARAAATDPPVVPAAPGASDVLRVSVRREAAWRVENLTASEWSGCSIRFGASRATFGTLSVRGAGVIQDAEFMPPVVGRPDPATAVVTCQMNGQSATALFGPPPPPNTSAITQYAPVPPAVGADSTIRTKCAAEWKDDFRMQAYCQTQQRDAFATIQRRGMLSANERTIRSKCRDEWPDDFKMQDYCEQQQLKALGSLR